MTSVLKHEVLSKRRSNQFVHPDKTSRKDEDKSSRKDEHKTQIEKRRQTTRIPRNNYRVLGEKAKASKECGNKLKSKDIFKFTDGHNNDEPSVIGDIQLSDVQSCDKTEQIMQNGNVDENSTSYATQESGIDKLDETRTHQKKETQNVAKQIANEPVEQNMCEVNDNPNLINDTDNPLNRSDQENICVDQQINDGLDKQTLSSNKSKTQTKTPNKPSKKPVLGEKSSGKLKSQLPRSQIGINRSQTNEINSEIQSKQTQIRPANAKPSSFDTKVKRSKSNTPSDDNKSEDDQQKYQTISASKSTKSVSMCRKNGDYQNNRKSSVSKFVAKETGIKAGESKSPREIVKSNTKSNTSVKLSEKTLSKHNLTYKYLNTVVKLSKSSDRPDTKLDQSDTKLDSSVDSSSHSNHEHVTFTMDKHDNGKNEVSTKAQKKRVSVTETRTSVMRRSRSRSITPGASSISSESSHSNKSTSSSNSSKTARNSKSRIIEGKVKSVDNSQLVREKITTTVASKSSATKSDHGVKSYMRTTESMKNKQSRSSESTVETMGIAKIQTTREIKSNQKTIQNRNKNNEGNAKKLKSGVQKEKSGYKGNNSMNDKADKNMDSLPSIRTEKVVESTKEKCEQKVKLLARNTQRSQNNSSIKQPIRKSLISQRNDSQIICPERTKIPLNKGSKISEKSLIPPRGKRESLQSLNIGTSKLSNKPKFSAIKTEECKSRQAAHKSKLITPLPRNVSNRVSKVSKQDFRSISTDSDSHVNSKAEKTIIAQQDSKSRQPTDQIGNSENIGRAENSRCKTEEINFQSEPLITVEFSQANCLENYEHHCDKKELSNSRKISTLEERQLSGKGNSDSVNTEHLLESGELGCSKNNIVLQEKRSKNGNQCESGVISEFFPSSNSGDMHSMIQIRDRFEVMNDKNSVSMETVCAIASECNEMSETGHCSVVRVDKLSGTLSDSQLSKIEGNIGERTQSISGPLTEELFSLHKMETSGNNCNIVKKGVVEQNQLKSSQNSVLPNTDMNESELLDNKTISDNYRGNKTCDKSDELNHQNNSFSTTCDECYSVTELKSVEMDLDQMNNLSQNVTDSRSNCFQEGATCESTENKSLYNTDTDILTVHEKQQNCFKEKINAHKSSKTSDSMTHYEQCCDQTKKNGKNESCDSFSSENEMGDIQQCRKSNEISDNTCNFKMFVTENEFRNHQNKYPRDSFTEKGICIYSKINDDDRINSYILMETGGNLRHQTGDEGCETQQNDNKNDKNRNIQLSTTGAPGSFKTDKSQAEARELISQSILCKDGNSDTPLSDKSRILGNRTLGESYSIDKGMQDCLEFRELITEESLFETNDGLNYQLNIESLNSGNIGKISTCLEKLENNENCCQATSENSEVQQTFTCNKAEENDKQRILSLLDNNCDKRPECDQEKRENSALNCPEISAYSQPARKLILQDDNKIPGNAELCWDNSAITNKQSQEIIVSGVTESQGSGYLNYSVKNESEYFRDKDNSCDVKVISEINGETPENSENRARVENMDLLDSCISANIEHLNVCQGFSGNEDFSECLIENCQENTLNCVSNKLAFGDQDVHRSNREEEFWYCKVKNKSVEKSLLEQDYVHIEKNAFSGSDLGENELVKRTGSNSLDDSCRDLLQKQINLNGGDLCAVYTQNFISESSITENVHQGNMAENDIKVNESTRVFDKKAQISQNVANSFMENDRCPETTQNSHFLNCYVEKTRTFDSDKEIKCLESKNKWDVVKIARQRETPSCRAKHHGKIEEFESSEQNPCPYQNNDQLVKPRKDIDTINCSGCKNSAIKSKDCISELNCISDLCSSSENHNIYQNEIILEHSILNKDKDMLYESVNKHSSEPISSTDHLSRLGDREKLQKEITPESLLSDLTQCSTITQMNINCDSVDQKENKSRSSTEKLASGSSEFGIDRKTEQIAGESARDLETTRDLCLIRLTDLDNRCELKSYNPNIHQDFPGDEMSDLSRLEFISQTCSCNQIVSENSTLPGDLPELNSTDQNSYQTRVICSVEADNSTCAVHSLNFSDSNRLEKGSHNSKLEFVYSSQTINPDISSDSIKRFNFEANNTGNQCINFDGNQPESLDTVQQDSDYQFNKSQTFDVHGLEHVDKNGFELPGLSAFNTALSKQNVLDYDAIDGQIFDKCENIQHNVTEKSSSFIDCGKLCTVEGKDQFTENCGREGEQTGNSRTNSDQNGFGTSEIISGNLQLLASQSDHGTCLNIGQSTELKGTDFKAETEGRLNDPDNVCFKDQPIVPRKNKFIKSSSTTNFVTHDTAGIELTTTSLSHQTLSTTKNLSFQNTNSGICDNAGEALCDNISDITDIFEDSGDNFVDAEETFDTDIDITDIDITNSSSCASDLYKQDDTLQEPGIIDVETDVTSGIVIDVVASEDKKSDPTEIYQCRENLTSTESFQDAFDDFIDDCTQKSKSGDKTPENENCMLQVSSSLPLDAQTSYENSENIVLDKELSIFGDNEIVILTGEEMERRRRREVSSITTIVTGSSVAQHVRSAEYRNSSAIKDISYQQTTSSSKLKESQHFIENQVFRSTDIRNESGQNVIENVINKTGNEELPVILCSVTTTGENSKVEFTPYSNLQNETCRVSESVPSENETSILDDVKSNKCSTATSEMSTVTSSEDVERQIETAVTIRTERRRRRQVQKTEAVSEVTIKNYTSTGNEISECESVKDKIKIDPGNSALILSRSERVTQENEPMSVYIDQSSKTTDPILNASNQISCPIENDSEHTEINSISMSDLENPVLQEQSTDVECIVKSEHTSASQNGIYLEIACSESLHSNDLNNGISITNQETKGNGKTLTCISSDGNTFDSSIHSHDVLGNEQTFTISVQAVQAAGKYDDLDDIEYIDADDIPEVDKNGSQDKQGDIVYSNENKFDSPNASFTLTFEIASDDECQSIEILDSERNTEQIHKDQSFENVDDVINEYRLTENDITICPVDISNQEDNESSFQSISVDNTLTAPFNEPGILLSSRAHTTDLHVHSSSKDVNISQSDEEEERRDSAKINSESISIQVKPISESNASPFDNDVIISCQDIEKSSCEIEEPESVVSEESNISVALALKLEREKLNKFNNNCVNAEDCNRSRSRTCQGKRNTRSASTGNFILQLESCETDNSDMLTNMKTGLSRRSIKKSSSFRIDRQNVYSPIDDSNVENMETIKNASKKVTDICRSFVQKARCTSRPRDQADEDRVISPTPQRKLMKWVNAKGKWLRIPVNESQNDIIDAKKEEKIEVAGKNEKSIVHIEPISNHELTKSEQSSNHELTENEQQIDSHVTSENKIKDVEFDPAKDSSNLKEKEQPIIDIKETSNKTNYEKLCGGFDKHNRELAIDQPNEIESIVCDKKSIGINPSSSCEIKDVGESCQDTIPNKVHHAETNKEIETDDSKLNIDSQCESATLEVGPRLVYSPTKPKPKLHLDIDKANDQLNIDQKEPPRPNTAPVKHEFPVLDKNDFLLGIKDNVSRRSLVKMLSPTRSPVKSPTSKFSVGNTFKSFETEETTVAPRRIPKLTAVKIQEEIFEGNPEYMKECNIDPLAIVSENNEKQVSTITEHRKSRQFKDINKSHTFTSLEEAKYRDKSPCSSNSAENVDNLAVNRDIKVLDLNSDQTIGTQQAESVPTNEVLEPKTPTCTDKRKVKLPVVLRDRSLQRPKLLSEIVEVEENKDDSQQTAHNIRSKQTQQQQSNNTKKERRLRKSGTTGNKRRSLSLPTGSLAFGDTRIVYKNGHFTFETMDDYKNDSSRPPDLSDEVDTKSVSNMHVTADSSPRIGEALITNGDRRDITENQRPGLKRQCAKTVLTKRDSDDNVFYNTDDVTAFNGQRNESYSNSSHMSDLSLDSIGLEDHETENDLITHRKSQQSSSSLPESGSSPTAKHEALRARRTSSFRRAQEAGTLDLISEQEGGSKLKESSQNSPSSQKSMPKRKTLNENMNLFSKQSESAKDFFSKRMNLKGLFKKTKPEIGLPTGSPLKTQHPVSPPIAAFQGDDDIGSIDTPPSSPGPNKDLRRRHTSADIYIKSFAEASANEFGSNCPTPTQERHTNKQTLSTPTTPCRELNSVASIPSNSSVCSFDDDRISVTSACSAASSSNSVQSPAMEQPHKPKTPKPIGASPRRSHSIGSQGSRTSYYSGHRDRSSTSVTSLESDNCDSVLSDFIVEGRCECEQRLSELMLRPDRKVIVDFTQSCQFCQNFLEYANSVGLFDGAKSDRQRRNSSNKDISGDSNTSAKTRKDSASRKSLEKLAIMSQTAVVSSNSNDSGIQRDVSAHSSNESIKGTQDGQVLLRRKKSPSPQTERPKSEAGVRWADLDLDTAEFHQPVRLRRHAQLFKDKPRPKSDLEGSSFLSERMKTFGSEIDLQPYCSLRNLYDMKKRDFDKRKNRRMSTPHPIKSRLHRSPKKLQKQPPLVRSSSMPESLDKITKRRKLHLLDYHMDSLHRQLDGEDYLSDDSDLSFDHASLQERSLSIQSSHSQLTSMDEDEDNLIFAEALWDHITMVPDEIAFRAQDVIEVMDMRDKDWWYGTIDDKEGWFPAAFVRLRVNQDQIEEEDMEITLQETLTSSPKSRRISVLNKNQARTNVVNEIINAEREYVKHLKDVVEGYIQHARKRKEMFPEERIALIFGNIETIYSFAQKFLAHLEECMDVCPHLSEIGQCFLDNVRGFEVYSDYCNNHPSACEELKELCLDSKYRHFFEACRLLQELVEIPLEGFLLTPVQKICKYPLQLAELLKYTPPDHADYTMVKDALSAMRKIATLINERKRKMESIEKIAAWQHTVVDWEGDDLLERSSELIFSGDINKVNTAGWSQERYFFLFDHQLIYCKKELLKRHVFSYKGRIDLDQCEVIDIPDGRDTQYNVSVKHGWKLHEIHKDKWYLLYGKTLAVKERWLKALKDERKRVKEDRENDFCVPDHWKQTVLNKVRSQSSLKDKHPTSRVNPSHQVPYQKDLKDFTYSTLPRRRLNSQKQDKKKGWFIFGGKKSKR